MTFKAGIGSIDYTPACGLPLMGNFRDDYTARGVHDPLCARALVLENADGTRCCVLSVDICMLSTENVSFMRDKIAATSKLDASRVLIAATHTHSGPAPMHLGPLPKADDNAVHSFLAKATEAVSIAVADIQPSRLRVGSACETRVSFNRRLRCSDGATHMNWEGVAPETVAAVLGPVDPQVLVLEIEQSSGRRAAAVNFGLHPAILAGDNWLYSADFPAYLSEALARIRGKEHVTAFWLGCCGNVNHIDFRDPLQGRGYKMAERTGYMLAVTVIEAIATAREVIPDAIHVSSETVQLTRLPLTSQERQRCQDVVASAAENVPAGTVDGVPEAYFAAARLMAHRRPGRTDGVEVMAIRVGDMAIVGLPAETFCEYGIALKQASPAAVTFVIALANGAAGYIPTRQAYGEGGYEPTPGACHYTEDAGELLVQSALRQLGSLFQE